MSNSILRTIKNLQNNFKTNKSINILFCDIQDKYTKNIYNYKDLISVAEDMAEASKILGLNQIVTLQEKVEVFGNTIKEIEAYYYEKTKVYNKTKFAMIEEELLQKSDDSVYILLGVEAHVCVTQTAINILKSNKDLIVLSDGVSSVQKGDRQMALKNLEKMGAYVTTSQSLLFLLLQDYNHPKFKSLLPILKRQFGRQNNLLNESKF